MKKLSNVLFLSTFVPPVRRDAVARKNKEEEKEKQNLKIRFRMWRPNVQGRDAILVQKFFRLQTFQHWTAACPL
jgi:hypothetical protein